MGAFFRQPGPSYQNQQHTKQLYEQLQRDNADHKMRHLAKQLHHEVSTAAKNIRAINKGLHDFKHDTQHAIEQDHEHMHGMEEWDHLSHEIQNLAGMTHTEIQHSPAAHSAEFQQLHHGEEGAAALFQLVAMFVIFLKRCQMAKPDYKARARKDAVQVKGWLNKIRALAKKR
jgi:hypothetical protein